MPIPPDTRSRGDSGHIADHNNIADELTALAAAVTSPPLGSVTFSTTTVNVDVSAANTYAVSLTGTPSGSTASFAITNAAGSGAQSLTLFITMGSGGPYTVNWQAGITWLAGAAPQLAAGTGALTIVQMETVNGGTAWYGALITGAPSLPLSVANGGTGQALYSPILNEWNAIDLGYKAQPFDAVTCTTTHVPTSGVLTLIGVKIRSPATITGARIIINNASAPTLTANQSFVGLYSAAGSPAPQLGYASTNSSGTALSTAFASTTPSNLIINFTATVSSPSSLILPVGLYWIVVLANGGTPPSFAGGVTISASSANGGLLNTNARFATYGSGLTALPSTITQTSSALSAVPIWAALF